MVLNFNILLPHLVGDEKAFPSYFPMKASNDKFQKLIKLIFSSKINNQPLNLFLTH